MTMAPYLVGGGLALVILFAAYILWMGANWR